MKGLKTILVLAVAFSVILISGCTQKKEEPFKIAIATWVGYGPFYVAQEKGFFEKEGLNVEISRIEDIGALRSALASKQLDGIVHTIDSWASSAAEGLQAKCILKIDESFGGDGIVVNKDVQSLADLKGKTVAFPQGLAGHYFFLHLLKQNGVKSSDINVQYMDAPDAASAFIANKVDAAFTWEPFLSEAGNTEHGKVLYTTADYPGLITDIFIIRNEVDKERKEDVKKFLSAWFKTLGYMKSNEEEAINIMKDKFGIPGEEIQGMLSGLKFTSLEENITAFDNEIITIFNDAGEVYKDAGLIKEPVTGSEYFDSSFLNEISK